MRKTGLCGVVIATLFGAAGLLQHPSHQVKAQNKQQQQQTYSSLAQAGVNLLNSSATIDGKPSKSSTLLPDGFLMVEYRQGPAPTEITAYEKDAPTRAAIFDQTVARAKAAQVAAAAAAAAQAQARAAAQAQAEAAAQAQAEAEARAQAQAAAQAQAQAEQQAQEQAAAAAQAQAQAQQQASQSTSSGVWLELRDCESGDDYQTDTGNGYYGAYQFSLATWEGLGFSGLPSQASPAVQDEAAQELQARSGWGQWPACSEELGLT
jgi:hypothetical protein